MCRGEQILGINLGEIGAFGANLYQNNTLALNYLYKIIT